MIRLWIGSTIWLIAASLFIIPEATRADTLYLETWTNASFAGFYQEFAPAGFNGTLTGSFVYDATSGQVIQHTHDTTILTINDVRVCGPGNCFPDVLYPPSFPRLLITEPTNEPQNEFDTTHLLYFANEIGVTGGFNPIIGGQTCLIVPNGDECDPFASVSGGLTLVPELSTWAMMLLGFAGLGVAGYRKVRPCGLGRVSAAKVVLDERPLAPGRPHSPLTRHGESGRHPPPSRVA